MLEYIRQQRPDTKWVVHLLTNVTFYVNKLFDHPIGARVVLPDHILKTNPSQDLLQTVSTTTRHDPCRLQGYSGWSGNTVILQFRRFSK
jgi:hypothetical protein